MTFGLALVAISRFWQSFLSVDSGFGFLAPGFVLMGIGIAFVMSPNAVDPTKAAWRRASSR